MVEVQRVLVIDDDPANNLICQILVSRTLVDVEIITYTQPAEGVAFIETTAEDPAPTLLLLDINMPQMSGWDVLENMQNLPAAVRNKFTIYMLSSSVDPADKEKAAAHPLVRGYFEKPLTRDKLMGLKAQFRVMLVPEC